MTALVFFVAVGWTLTAEIGSVITWPPQGIFRLLLLGTVVGILGGFLLRDVKARRDGEQ